MFYDLQKPSHSQETLLSFFFSNTSVLFIWKKKRMILKTEAIIKRFFGLYSLVHCVMKIEYTNSMYF